MSVEEIVKRYTKTISYQDVLKKAIDVFQDKDKAFNWYVTKTEALDNKAPYEFVKSGHGYHVMRMLNELEI